MNLSDDDITLLFEYLRDRPECLEEGTRESVIATCEAIVNSLRTPIEIARKNAFPTLDHAVTRAAIELDIFSSLLPTKGAQSLVMKTTELAACARPPRDPSLMRRLLRYLARPLCLIVEEGPDTWSLSSSGRVLAQETFNAGCKLYFDSCGPSFLALPSVVSAIGPGMDTKSTLLVHGNAASLLTEPDFFESLHKTPARLQNFHTWMDTLAEHQYASQQQIDFGKWIAGDLLPKDVAFVDVGGGSGAQCLMLRQKRGHNVAGRIVNQDRIEIISKVQGHLADAGVETLAHNFFEDQPIKGTLLEEWILPACQQA